MRAVAAWFGLFLCSCSLAEAGILVVHSDKSYSFLEAYDLTVNGKDKLLSLGSRPVLSEKPPQVEVTSTLVRDAESGVFAQVSGPSVDYNAPRNKGKSENLTAAELWKAASISYRADPKDKAATDVAADKFVAYLPGTSEDLIKLVKDEKALSLIGGKADIFDTQLSLLAAVAGFYKSGPNSAALARYVEDAMRQRLDSFQSGNAGLDTLNQARRFADLSAAAYPNNPEQAKLRQSLADLQQRLDRRVAVLNAFSATEEWDPFLLASRDFNVYQDAFPDIARKHLLALQASLKAHQANGETLLQSGDYAGAYREFRIALARNPSDEKLQERRFIAWSDYSRQVAVDHKGKRKQVTAGQEDALARDLSFATRYKDEGKLDEALTKVQEAEAIDAENLEMLLLKASLLGAQGDFTKAFATLDAYDLLAIDEERKKGAQLRNELLFKRSSRVEEAKVKVQTAWKQMNFLQAREAAISGLHAKDDDPDLLYFAAASSLAARDGNDAHDYLTRYLDLSDTLSSNAQQSAAVRHLMTFKARTLAIPAGGVPDWMSGAKLPAGVYYDPFSLSFVPHVERIEASGKMKVAYEWQNGHLLAIVPSWEKPDQATGERRISFVYDDAAHQAVRATDAEVKQPTVNWKGDEYIANSSLISLNNPFVDPIAVEQLTGKSIAVTVAGNPYFHPFVWSKPCYFQLSYDEQGRVARARQLTDFHGTPADNLVEFEWQGLQLAAVRAYHVSGTQKTLVYTRTLQYDGNLLVGEDVDGQGKAAHIKYKYEGTRLVAASCDKDSTLDGRSRQISFAGAE